MMRMEGMTAIFVVVMLAATIQMVPCTGYQIGVNYGRMGDNLPSPEQVVSLYKRCGVESMRLFEPSNEVSEALRSSGLKVSLGVRNEDLQTLSTGTEAAQSWVSANIVPYKDDVVFAWVTLGNEVVPGPLAQYVAPAMTNMRAALDSVGLTSTKVTTVVAMTVLGAAFPPSAGAFGTDSLAAMTDIARFLQSTGSPLMLNVYPYFAYSANAAEVPLDYAMFEGKAVVADGELRYFSLFDAMVDGVHAALEKVGAAEVRIAVGESGWPSDGGPYASKENAEMYNCNMYDRVMRAASPGTPRRPETFVETFVFAMFNEDLKAAGVEQNFGLFYPNMTPVYQPFLCCS